VKTRAVLVALIPLLLLAGCSKPAPRVVLYSAQDQEFAEKVLAEFTKRTGLAVTPKYDTEATKSVSLTAELAMEAKRPRCDLHWNNEIIGTIQLARQGVYEPYASPALRALAQPGSPQLQPADHTWTAFAERARVIVANPQQVAESDRPRSILDLTDPKWKGKVALAKPLFGTTATQAAALFSVLGPDVAKEFYRGLKANDVQIVAGNHQVAEGVARGQFAVGLTDTDDALGEIEAGRPLSMIFPDRDDNPKEPKLGVLYIPNTLAVIKGCPNPAGAKQLIDYLLSPEVEVMLAEGPSHQIPVNPSVKAKLPANVATRDQVKVMQVDWNAAADRWEESQRFLVELFGK
jgi:iron(III) transport system substrate-binding protein